MHSLKVKIKLSQCSVLMHTHTHTHRDTHTLSLSVPADYRADHFLNFLMTTAGLVFDPPADNKTPNYLKKSA